jgi:multicomponent Na+:H+ antiporter subunit D
MSIHQSQLAILVVAIPLLFALVTPVVGWWKRKWCWPLVVVALALSLVASMGIAYSVVIDGPLSYYLGGWEPPWGIEYRIDHLGAFMTLVLTFISLMAAVYARRSIERELPDREPSFYCVFLLLVTGLLGIVVTGDMFNLYVFLEIASLTAYALIAVGEERAAFSAFRYVIVGTIGACFYLLGVGYLYIVTGSLNMADLSEILPQLHDSRVVLVAFGFLLIGIAMKMALFPLHVWLPDSYTYAPSAVSALLAPLMTKVGAYVMIRIMFGIFGPVFSIEVAPTTTLLSSIAAIAILVGCVMALAQVDLKRMLSYILVAEVGYIALGVGLANRNGLTGAILHIVNDAFMMGCLFFAVGAVFYKTGTRNIYQLGYLHRRMPFTMGALVVAGLSVIGIPPLCGFFSKWYLILGAIDGQQWIFVAVLLASSLLSAILFFRVIDNAYFDHMQASSGDSHPGSGVARSQRAEIDEAPLSMLVPTLVTALGVVVLGVSSMKIISTLIQHAVPASF